MTSALFDAAPEVTDWGGRDAGIELGLGPPRSNVLLVEDDVVSRDVALVMLGRLGYRADVAENGVEALASLHSAAYDLVLMDLQMPEMDGIEATRRIRAELGPEGQPTVIAMTASISIDDRTRCLDAGMDDFLSKPVHLEELAAVLADRGAPAPSVMAPPARPVDPAVYDPALLDALVADLGADGEEVRRDLIETFLAEAEHTVTAITAAERDADGGALTFAAHALKAASGTLGLLALANAARSIEDSFRAAPVHMDIRAEATGLIIELRRAIVALRAALVVEPPRRIGSAPSLAPGFEPFGPRPG